MLKQYDLRRLKHSAPRWRRSRRRRRQHETNHMSEEEVKNHCFLCSLNGRSDSECCIELQPSSKPTTFLNGHRRKKKEVTCEWFDTKFPEGHADRETKKALAKRTRDQAAQNRRRRKKQAKRGQ